MWTDLLHLLGLDCQIQATIAQSQAHNGDLAIPSEQENLWSEASPDAGGTVIFG